jgi:hypothetical protein
MKAWIKKITHIHIYRHHHFAGANEYLQCRCGERKWQPHFTSLYSPVDRGWISGLEPNEECKETLAVPPPPNKRSRYKNGKWG